MVEKINRNIFHGIAGRRAIGSKPKGVVIHNDAGAMSAKSYIGYLQNLYKAGNSARGFAHYYGDRNAMVRVEDTFNGAWHTANSDGNANYVGYEVCQSLSASDKDFLANEQAVFKQVAEDLKYWGITPNRDTVRLHKEFSSTSCPHRSWELHGRSVNAVKDYFISQIKKYMGGSTPSPKPKNGAKPNQTKYVIGTTVEVLSSAYAYQTGQIIPGFVKGKRYKVKQVKEVNQSHSRYAFLLEGVNSWFLAQDLKQVSAPSVPSKAGGFKVGQTVTLLNKATRYQTGQKIASFAKNKKYKILQVKNVNQSNSKQAVLLSGIMSWVLAQDVR